MGKSRKHSRDLLAKDMRYASKIRKQHLDDLKHKELEEEITYDDSLETTRNEE